MDAIEKSKRISLARFLYSLGIRHVGEHVAELLADHFHDLAAIRDCPREELELIEGIGPIVAESIANFLGQESNLQIINQLLDNGVKLKIADRIKNDRLKDRVFVLTGTLPNLTRSQAQALIAAAGGKVSGSVSGNTDYVVAGESAGSKLNKAKELGVKIIDEAALKEMLGR